MAGSGSIKRWQTPGRSLPARSLKLQKTPHCGGEIYCTYHLVISCHILSFTLVESAPLFWGPTSTAENHLSQAQCQSASPKPFSVQRANFLIQDGATVAYVTVNASPCQPTSPCQPMPALEMVLSTETVGSCRKPEQQIATVSSQYKVEDGMMHNVGTG